MTRTLRTVTFSFAALVFASYVFFLYSYWVFFGNWPWTRTEVFSDSHLGFAIHSSKYQVFQQAIDLQQRGEIVALRIAFTPPHIYKKKYKRTPIRQRDYVHVYSYDRWYLPLSECNCWLHLEFSDGQLSKITRFEYRGPPV